MDLDLGFRVHAGMHQRFGQRLVGFGQVDILADEGDVDLVLWVHQRVRQLVPDLEVSRLGQDAELVTDDLVEHLVVQHGRNFVDRIGVQRLDHRLALHIAEQRDLGFLVFRNVAVGATEQHVGLDTDFAQFLDRVLGRFGLQLAGGRNVGQQCQVHVAGVVAAFFQAHLTDGFEEGQRLDVADRTADFDDGHVGPVGATFDRILDLVGDVRDDLHRLAEVFAAPFLLDHRLVDLAGGEVVRFLHFGAGEALVMAKVEVGFRTVFGDEDFAVLERAHRARVDVDVGIKLEVGDFQAPGFEDGPERGGGDALTERGHHTAGDKHVFGHDFSAAGKHDFT